MNRVTVEMLKAPPVGNENATHKIIIYVGNGDEVFGVKLCWCSTPEAHEKS